MSIARTIHSSKCVAALLAGVLAVNIFSIGAIDSFAQTDLTAAATTRITNNTTTTSASGIELSAEPVYQEEQITVSETPINETHIQSSVAGNGTINLPNSTETINNINNGSYIISLKDGSVFGKEVWSTEDETENVTTTFYSIIRFGMEEEQQTGEGIIIATVDTNSTGKLGPLDGMILAGKVEFRPDESRLITLWEWESGIPLRTGNTTATEEPPQLQITNATTAADTNATATTAAPPEEEVIVEEQQQQQQTTPTLPPTPMLE